jgi:hypothetical protein
MPRIWVMSTSATGDTEEDANTRLVFFHMVATSPPTINDFRSNQERGRTPRKPLTSEQQELWSGISAYESWAQARRKAGASPWLGEYIAELHIPPGSEIRMRRTTSSRGHWTVWGEPALLLACVVSVTPMRAQQPT